MLDVYLHGNLAEKYGPHFRLDVSSVGEACRALQANFNDFFETIRPGAFRIISGDRRRGEKFTAEQLSMRLGGEKPIHIVPVIAGSKNTAKGIITIILGVILIVVAWYLAPAGAGLAGAAAATAVELPVIGAVTVGQLAMLGALLALGGVMQLLAPTTDVTDYSSREDKQVSFIFNGPVNRKAQGGAMPIVFGQFRVGSIMVSGGITLNETQSGYTDYAYICITGTKYNDNSGGWVYPSPISVTAEGVPYYQVQEGQDVTFSISTVGWPFILTDVIIDGVSQGPITSYTFANCVGTHAMEIVTSYAEGYTPDDPYAGSGGDL